MTISEEWSTTVLDKSFELNTDLPDGNSLENLANWICSSSLSIFSNVLPVEDRQSISDTAASAKVFLSLFGQLQQNTEPSTVSSYLAIAAKSSTAKIIHNNGCAELQCLGSRHDERIRPGNQRYGQLHPRLQDRFGPRCTLTRQTLVFPDLLLTLWPCSSRQPVTFS